MVPLDSVIMGEDCGKVHNLRIARVRFRIKELSPIGAVKDLSHNGRKTASCSVMMTLWESLAGASLLFFYCLEQHIQLFMLSISFSSPVKRAFQVLHSARLDFTVV